MKSILAQLTSEHITSLIGLANLTVTLVLIPLVTFLITRQKTSETKILSAGSERETRLAAKVDVVESKADKAYSEANNVNVKLASMGIQTQPGLGSSAENPVHTVTP